MNMTWSEEVLEVKVGMTVNLYSTLVYISFNYTYLFTLEIIR